MSDTFNTKDNTKIDEQASQNEALDVADAKRAGELASAKTMEAIKQKALIKESARLTAKYGKDDARVKTMNIRISYSPSIQAVYQNEVGRLSVPAGTVPVDGWLVQGLVYSADGKVMPGVTIFLSGDGKTAWAGLPFSCTPASGAYSIALNSDQLGEVQGKDLWLAVSDANKQVLYIDSNKVSDHLQKNTIYSHNIRIGGACTAPPGGNPQEGSASGVK